MHAAFIASLAEEPVFCSGHVVVEDSSTLRTMSRPLSLERSEKSASNLDCPLVFETFAATILEPFLNHEPLAILPLLFQYWSGCGVLSASMRWPLSQMVAESSERILAIPNSELNGEVQLNDFLK